MSTLDECVNEFIAAGRRRLREKIVAKHVRNFKTYSGEDEKEASDEIVFLTTVSASSAVFQVLCSHRFLAYSPVPVREAQACHKGVHS